MKRRALRIVLIVVGIVGFTVYFAFSTFFFSPLEDDYRYDVSTLIPRDVDFFVAKAELRDDFSTFPELATAEELAGSRSVAAWEETPLYRDAVQPRLAELRTSLAEALGQLPIPVEPLDVLGGRDLAVAGYFDGPDLANARWAVYGRTNWMGKLGLALLDYPGLVGLEAQGLSVASDEEVVTLSGGRLAAPVSLTRVQDVLVAGSDPELVRSARSLDLASGADSFGQSARYADWIDRPDREGDELEFFVDYLTLAEELRLTGRWPDTLSEDFAPAFLGRLFQTAAFRELVGNVSFRDGIAIDAHGEFSSELVTPVQKKLYRTRHFDRDRFRNEVAQLVPIDAGLFAYLHGDVGDLLRQALDALDSATLGLVEDQIRAVWGYGTADTLIEDAEKALHDRVGLVVRPHDYPADPDDPPHDGRPVPAWCLVLWAGDVGELEEIHSTVIRNQSKFGLQGPEPGSNGVYTHTVEGGFTVWEFWSMQIPGTGHVAMSMPVGSGDFFLIGNSFRIVEQLLKTFYEGAPRYPRLTDDPVFQEMVFDGLPSATVMAWLSPRPMGDSLRAMLREQAALGVTLDLGLERTRLERLVLQERYGGRAVDALTPGERSAFQSLVDQEVRELVDRVEAEQVPALYAEYERNVTMSEIVRGALVQLALEPSRFDLGLQVKLDPRTELVGEP